MVPLAKIILFDKTEMKNQLFFDKTEMKNQLFFDKTERNSVSIITLIRPFCVLFNMKVRP